MLLERLLDISKGKKRQSLSKWTLPTHALHSLNIQRRRTEANHIAKENYKIARRLNIVQPTVSCNLLLKDQIKFSKFRSLHSNKFELQKL